MIICFNPLCWYWFVQLFFALYCIAVTPTDAEGFVIQRASCPLHACVPFHVGTHIMLFELVKFNFDSENRCPLSAMNTVHLFQFSNPLLIVQWDAVVEPQTLDDITVVPEAASPIKMWADNSPNGRIIIVLEGSVLTDEGGATFLQVFVLMCH